MSHHRTSVRKGLELASALSSCGRFSGRTKPRYAVLSDIGKIVLYQGTVLRHRVEDNCLLLRSGFTLSERLTWNPDWRQPESCVVEADGTLLTWYADGTDDVVTDWFSAEQARDGSLIGLRRTAARRTR
jgi:lysine 2,3-aminomutase